MRKVKFLLLLVFSFMVISLNYQIKADTVVMPTMVITNPGENSSTEMNISYHIAKEGTNIIYSETNDFDGPVKFAETECNPIPFANSDGVLQCTANLTDLKPNTRYYYQVNHSGMEEVMSFKTAGESEFTFAHVTDIHSYYNGGRNSRVEAANKVLNALNKAKELDFVLASGDVTAYGTFYEQWEALFEMDMLKSNMFAVTPGNHDYYDGGAKVVGVQYFNSVTNNPKNGAEGVKNNSYFFKYGNALFVSLDSEAAANNATLRENQIKWLNEVTANNPADFIIVFTHRPFYTGDSENAGQARDMKTYFQEIFDNTGVDLVLSGHNHVYARTYQVYQDDVIKGSSLGTVYLTGIQIGDRYKTDPKTKQPQVEIAHLGSGEDGGSIITVREDRIAIEFVKHDGTKHFPYVIYGKSPKINKANIESEISVSKLEDDIQLQYKLPNPGLIKKINVYDEENELLATSLNPTEELIEILDAPAVGRYNIKVEMILRNSEVIEKNLTVIDSRYDFGTIENVQTEEEDFQTTLKWNANLNADKVSHYEIYVNDVLLKEVPANQQSTILDQVSPYKENQISLRLFDKMNEELYRYEFTFGENSDPMTIAFKESSIKLNVDDQQELEYTLTPNENVKVEFTSSNPDVAYVDSKGNLIAVGEGTCTITVNVAKRWEVNSEITVTVEAKPVEKKGCFSSGYIFVGISVLGLAFVLRRRKI